jgi:large subunit ribosomal protein L25
MLTLAAKKRTSELSSELIQDRKIPAVVYGPGIDNVSISLDYEEFKKLVKQARYHQVIHLDIDKKIYKVLMKEFQRDPVKDNYTHVDFYCFNEKKDIIVPVPVEFEGESPAMKVGALLTVTTYYVKVKALPANVPEKIMADISILKIDGDKIRLENIPKIDKVEFMMPDNTMLAKAELSRAGKKMAGEDEDEESAVAEGAAEAADGADQKEEKKDDK